MKMRLFGVQLLAGALTLDYFTAFSQGGVNGVSVTSNHYYQPEQAYEFSPMMAELQSEKDGDTGYYETILTETNSESNKAAATTAKKPAATKKAAGKTAATKKAPAKPAATKKAAAKTASNKKAPAKQTVSVARLQKRNAKIEKVQDQKQDLRMKLNQANKDKAQLQKEVKSLLAMSESTLSSMDKTSKTFQQIIESITQKFNVIAKQADAGAVKAGTPQKPAQAKKVPQAQQNPVKKPAKAPAKQPAQKAAPASPAPTQAPAPAPAAPAPAQEEDTSLLEDIGSAVGEGLDNVFGF